MLTPAARRLHERLGIRTTGDEKDVAVIVGKGGNIDLAPNFQTILKDGSGKSFPGYAQAITGYIGMTIGTQFSVARLANVGTITFDRRAFVAVVRTVQRGRAAHAFCDEPPIANATPALTNHLLADRFGSQDSRQLNGIPFVITQSIGNAETALTSTPIATPRRPRCNKLANAAGIAGRVSALPDNLVTDSR